MSGDLNRRLGRLGDHFGAKGCATCREWGPSRVFIIDPRATEVPDMSRPPARCPDCRRRIVKSDDVVIALDLGDDRWYEPPESPIAPAPDAPAVAREYAGIGDCVEVGVAT